MTEKYKVTLSSLAEQDETPFETLQRLTNWFYQGEEDEYLDQLPNMQAILDFFYMVIKSYDVSLMSEVDERLEEGKDPTAYNEFVKKHLLPWPIRKNGNWVQE